MSRPPNHQQLSSSYSNSNNRGGLIDFVNVPCQLGQPYDEGYAYHPSIYAQAGFPGYQQCNNNNPAYPLAAPAYLPYDNYSGNYGNNYGSSNTVGSSMPPVESEAVLHQRINDKIDAIIQAQKETTLNSKIESLSNKVEQLTHNLSGNMAPESSDTAHIHHLSDKVQQISESLELLHGNSLGSGFRNGSLTNSRGSFMNSSFNAPDVPVHISSEPSDAEISRRLRRLAAESSMLAAESSYRIPDW